MTAAWRCVLSLAALLLESAMTQAGFEPYRGEWWHYSDSVKYDVP